jgi:hypothetical protein
VERKDEKKKKTDIQGKNVVSDEDVEIKTGQCKKGCCFYSLKISPSGLSLGNIIVDYGGYSFLTSFPLMKMKNIQSSSEVNFIPETSVSSPIYLVRNMVSVIQKNKKSNTPSSFSFKKVQIVTDEMVELFEMLNNDKLKEKLICSEIDDVQQIAKCCEESQSKTLSFSNRVDFMGLMYVPETSELFLKP